MTDDILQRAAERVQDSMDEILANFKPGAKITVLVRTPGKPTADFCMTDDELDEVAAMVQRRKGEAPPQDHVTGPSDRELLDVLASNSWDLRCISVPTGGDDAEIDWIIIEHHQGEPQERTIAQAYADDPRAAIRRAIRETDKNAARCVSCDEVLHDGDSVYYEHGEGGHIHSWCTSDNPESFVDEDEVPLKAGDEIQKPFAYSVAKYECSEAPAPQTINIAGYAHQEAVTYAEWLRAGNSTGELSDHAIEGLEKHFVHVIRHTLSVRLGDLEINPPETQAQAAETSPHIPAAAPSVRRMPGRTAFTPSQNIPDREA